MTTITIKTNDGETNIARDLIDQYSVFVRDIKDDDDNIIYLPELTLKTFKEIFRLLQNYNQNKSIDLSFIYGDSIPIQDLEMGQLYRGLDYLGIIPEVIYTLTEIINSNFDYIINIYKVLKDTKLFNKLIVDIVRYRTSNELDLCTTIQQLRTHNINIPNPLKCIKCAICIDITSSMGPTIDAQKRHSYKLFKEINAAYPKLLILYQIYAYRDHSDDNNLIISKVITTLSEMVTFLQKLTALGGGDIPEAPELAFNAIYNSDFFEVSKTTKNIMIVITDAMPHRFGSESLLKRMSYSIEDTASEEFSKIHGDWASILIKIIKKYNTIIHCADVSNNNHYTHLWMSVICEMSASGTSPQKSILQIINYVIKDIMLYSFERFILHSSHESLNDELKDKILDKIIENNTTILDKETQENIGTIVNDTVNDPFIGTSIIRSITTSLYSIIQQPNIGHHGLTRHHTISDSPSLKRSHTISGSSSTLRAGCSSDHLSRPTLKRLSESPDDADDVDGADCHLVLPVLTRSRTTCSRRHN